MRNPKPRITFNMSMPQLMMALSDGNPGALRVCMEILTKGGDIDADAGDGLLALLYLDTLGIYGPSIWILYKDVCDHRLPQLLAILRADQLGQLEGVDDNLIQAAVSEDYRDPGAGEAVKKLRGLLPAVMAAVQKELPNFNKPVTPAAAPAT